MKERPIIMSAESVQAILDGRKTQTRMVVKVANGMPCGVGVHFDGKTKGLKAFYINANGDINDYRCPHGQKGDRLWVKETFLNYQLLLARKGKGHAPDYYEEYFDGEFAYKSDGYNTVKSFKRDKIIMTDGCIDCEVDGNKWKSPLFMPKKASRLTLEITNVRVERLQDITEDDAIAEGIKLNKSEFNNSYQCKDYLDDENFYFDAKGSYESLWDKLNAKRGYSWDSNPFVWVIEFRRVEE